VTTLWRAGELVQRVRGGDHRSCTHVVVSAARDEPLKKAKPTSRRLVHDDAIEGLEGKVLQLCVDESDSSSWPSYLNFVKLLIRANVFSDRVLVSGGLQPAG
jgi:hypothetical protein